MSTRGLICRQINNREVEYLYCHHDNYLEHNGVILQEHYNTKEKVDELFAKNRGISVLHKSIEEGVFYDSEGDAMRKCPLNFLNTRADSCWAEYIYVFILKGEWKFKKSISLPNKRGEWICDWSKFEDLAKAVKQLSQQSA